jgi:hypothetical protein
MCDVTFEAVLTTVDGKPYTAGPVSVSVIVGDSEPEPGLGATFHKTGGLWRYYPDDSEIGAFKTVVAFTADGVTPAFDRRNAPPSLPVIPHSLADAQSITREHFLSLTAGKAPRKDYEFWVSQLLQADPIPLNDRIRQALLLAYPHTFT